MQVKVVDKIYEDLCYKSIGYLEEMTRTYLKDKYNIENPWILDSISGAKDFEATAEITDIVFFGGYIQRFFESGLWTTEKMRFWVLTKTLKTVLVKEFGLDKNAIHIIPRNELTQCDNLLNLDQTKKWDLVYAGRISDSKNIESTLYLVNHLQNIHNIDCELNLFGDFDNMSGIYGLKEDLFDFENRIKNIISKLNWKTKPIFHGEVASDDWINRSFDNPVYLSLSTFLSEDFAVSVHQAQMKGWPMILSNWGAHNDIVTENSYKLDSSNLIEKSGHSELLFERTKLSAIELVGKLKSNNKQNSNFESKEQNLDATITLSELNQARLNFCKQYGVNSIYLVRGHNNKFYDQLAGRSFFDRLETYYTGQENKKIDEVIIINDLSEKVAGVLDKCLSYLASELPQGKNIEFIPLHKLMRKDSVLKMQAANKVHFAITEKSIDTSFDAISNLVGKQKVAKL